MIEGIIVAHRGLSALYPENTALALEKAISCGVGAVEFDVQFTADRVPVVFHDPGLRRLCGRFGSLFSKKWSELQRYSTHYPRRFGQRYQDCRLLSLEDCVGLLSDFPHVTACVEIKEESIEQFGLTEVVDSLVASVAALEGRVQFLSFSRDVIEYLHALGVRETNWVLERTDASVREAAERLRPSNLACRIPILPDPIWAGPWDWMVYQTESPREVLDLFERGVRYVESDNVALLAESLPEYFNNHQ